VERRRRGRVGVWGGGGCEWVGGKGGGKRGRWVVEKWGEVRWRCVSGGGGGGGGGWVGGGGVGRGRGWGGPVTSDFWDINSDSKALVSKK